MDQMDQRKKLNALRVRVMGNQIPLVHLVQLQIADERTTQRKAEIMIISQGYPLWVGHYHASGFDMEPIIAWDFDEPGAKPYPVTATCGTIWNRDNLTACVAEAERDELLAELRKGQAESR